MPCDNRFLKGIIWPNEKSTASSSSKSHRDYQAHHCALGPPVCFILPLEGRGLQSLPSDNALAILGLTTLVSWLAKPMVILSSFPFWAFKFLFTIYCFPVLKCAWGGSLIRKRLPDLATCLSLFLILGASDGLISTSSVVIVISSHRLTCLTPSPKCASSSPTSFVYFPHQTFD